MTDVLESNRPSPRLIDARRSGARWASARSGHDRHRPGRRQPSGFLGLSATGIADPPTMLSIDSGLGARRGAQHAPTDQYLGRDAGTSPTCSPRPVPRVPPAELRWGTLSTGAPVFSNAVARSDCVLESRRYSRPDRRRQVVDVVARGICDP
jgi:hypothetical protein